MPREASRVDYDNLYLVLTYLHSYYGAEITIKSVSVNGTAQTISNTKNVDISALTGATVNGAALTPSNGVIALSIPITSITVNGTAVTPSNGVAEITAVTGVKIDNTTLSPTNGVVDLTTDINSLINTAISGITGISFEIVSTLPSSGTAGKIYLVSHGGSGTNVYDEYIYYNNAWEMLGTTAVDLTGYYNTTNLTALTTYEINTIFNTVFGTSYPTSAS